MSTIPLRLALVVASTRESRLGGAVATWFADVARQHPDFVVDVIDLRELDLPAVQSDAHPKTGRYGARVVPFAERVAAADAFVFVTPEYNHGYPASLKTALDAVYAEWNAKPASFVAYGGVAGGVRAVEQLRQVLAELHVADVREAVLVPMAGQRVDGGELVDDGSLSTAAKVMLDQLAWWGEALRAAREQRPYGS